MPRHAQETTTLDFRLLFESSPGLYLVLWPNLTIAAVSDAYLQATMTSRQEILGRHIFEVFPDNPADPDATGVRNLTASLDRVLRTRTADTMAVQKYDIRRPADQGGEFVERYWSPVNSPVLAADGAVAFIIHRVEDVTEFVHLREQHAEMSSLTAELQVRQEHLEAEVYKRAQQIQDLNRQLDRALQDARELFHSSPTGSAKVDARGRFIDVNQKLCEITGYTREELLTMSIAQLTHPEDRPQYQELFEAMMRGQTKQYATRKRYIRKDGSIAWVETLAAPLGPVNGKHAYASDVTIDVTMMTALEESLADSERRFRGTFENAPIAISHMDLDGRWIRVNDFFCKALGYSREELLSSYLADLLSPDDYQAEVAQMRRLITGEINEYYLERLYTRKDGSKIWGGMTCALQRDEAGRPEYFIRFTQDLTARKRAEDELRESEERFRALVNASSEVIYVMSPDWSEMRHLSGGLFLSDTQGPTRDWLKTYIPADEHPRVMAGIQRAIRTKSVFAMEHKVLRADGDIGWTISRAIPRLGGDGEIIEWFGAAADVTPRKLAEASLQRANVELLRSNDDLEQLALLLSHDLQEPLRMVTGFLTLLREQYEEKLGSKGQEYIAIAADGAERMSQMIRDLLDFARITSRGKGPARTSMRDAYDRAIADLRPRIEQTEASVTCGELPDVMGDQTQVARVLLNLIGNALKFRHPHRRPSIHVDCTREGETHLRFSVRDNGVGIPASWREKVFTLFSRLNSDQEGTGVGLAVVKKIIERHNGRVWLESTPDQGSTFYFTLPAA